MLNAKHSILVLTMLCPILGGPVRAQDQQALPLSVEKVDLPEHCRPIVAGVFAVGDPSAQTPRTSQGITLPTVLPETKVAPVYPEAARKAGVQGKVQVGAVVCQDGVVAAAQVLRAPSPELGTAAAEAVLKWKFNPAMKDGKPVAVRYTVALDVKP